MGPFLLSMMRPLIFVAAMLAVLALGSVFKDVLLFKGTFLCASGSEISIIIAVLLGVIAYLVRAAKSSSS
jgi:hypothetical protein